MAYEGLLNNKNAEQWTEDESLILFNRSIALSNQDEYDFIGEIARDLGVYRELFSYLAKKFKSCKYLYDIVLSNLEANCFSHSKNGKIKEATAIVNLKSNYKWTDRNDHTSDGKELKGFTEKPMTKKELEEYKESLENDN